MSNVAIFKDPAPGRELQEYLNSLSGQMCNGRRRAEIDNWLAAWSERWGLREDRIQYFMWEDIAGLHIRFYSLTHVMVVTLGRYYDFTSLSG